jgi:hypothetical protein
VVKNTPGKKTPKKMLMSRTLPNDENAEESITNKGYSMNIGKIINTFSA